MNRGYFGIGVYHAKKDVNIGTLMRSACCFGASFVFTIGRRYSRQAADTVHSMKNIPCYHYADIEELKEHIPVGCRIVGVELIDSAREVGRYSHPDRAIYLLGAEDHGLTPKALSHCHDVVVIPGASRCLNVSAAGSIVLYDRIRHFSTRPLGKIA